MGNTVEFVESFEKYLVKLLEIQIYKEFGPIVQELDDHLSHILCVLRVLSFTRGFPPHSATRRCQISGQKTFSKAWYYSCSMLNVWSTKDKVF